MSTPTDLVISRLQEHDCNPIRSGDGWSARCPAHEDRGPSLTVTPGDDGRALVYCHAGCETEVVVSKVGMKMADLMPSTNGNGSAAKWNIDKTYDYTNESADLIFQVCRTSPKGFRQRQPKPGGGWNYSVKGCRQVPYRLPELVKASVDETVFIPEGEKDVDQLRKLGLIATCNAGGAGKWKAEFGQYLEGCQVVILPDNDDPGRTHAQQVARSLHGTAALVKVIELPDLPEKGDVSDWLDAGGTVEQLSTIVDAAAEWEPKESPRVETALPSGFPLTDSGNAERFAANHDDKVRFEGVSCRELAAAKYDVEFLIDNTLVAGQPCMIGAAQKTLKTIIAIDAAVSLATATPFLGTLEVDRAATVGFMSGEGGLSVLQDYSRRVAAGRGIELGDIGGLFFCNTLPQLADLRHLDGLEQFILDHELAVIILDPLYLCMPGDEAGNLLKQGKILRNVNTVCVRNGCTPLLIHHTKKNVIDPFAPAELSDLSWSGFAEFAGQWWLLSRREKYDADKPGEHALWMNIGGRAGHSALHALNVHEGTRSDLAGRRWEVETLTPQEARIGARDGRDEAKAERQAEQLEASRIQLVRTLTKIGKPESKTTIRGMAGLGNGQRFEAPWGSLIEDGSIVLDGTILKGNKRTYDAFRVSEEQAVNDG